jgi:hypothetical protein
MIFSGILEHLSRCLVPLLSSQQATKYHDLDDAIKRRFLQRLREGEVECLNVEVFLHVRGEHVKVPHGLVLKFGHEMLICEYPRVDVEFGIGANEPLVPFALRHAFLAKGNDAVNEKGEETLDNVMMSVRELWNFGHALLESTT